MSAQLRTSEVDFLMMDSEGMSESWSHDQQEAFLCLNASYHINWFYESELIKVTVLSLSLSHLLTEAHPIYVP